MAFESLTRNVSVILSFFNEKSELIDISRSVKQLTLKQITNSGNVLKMGEFCMNSLEFEYYSEIIKEEGIDPIAWNNKRVKLSFTEGNTEEERKENKTDVGIFYVSAKDVETSNNGNTYTVTGYDLPSIMSEEFDTTKAGTSVEGIVNYICNLSGLKFVDGTTFSLGQIKSVDEGATNIEVLGLIAGYDGKNIRVNGNGELETYWYYDNSADASKLYTITRGVQLLNEFTKKEVVSPLNALTSGRADENGGSAVTVGSGVSLTYENQYMTKEKLTEIFNRVKGFEYSVGSVKWRYNPRVRCGDLVRIETGNDEYVLFPVMEQTVTYDGGMNSVCESYTYESENTVMGNKSPTQKKLEVIYNGLLAEFQKQSGIINNALKGGYYRLLQDENTKYPYGWQIADSEEILPTTKGWRWTQGGLMHSSDGFRTADRIAFTEDGHLSADMITAGSITIGALNEEVTNKIDSAQSSADKANTSANDAQISANNAQQTASNASSKADKAQSSADNAVNVSQQATQKAKEAQDKANSASDLATNALNDVNNISQIVKIDSQGVRILESANSNNYVHHRSDGSHFYTNGTEDGLIGPDSKINNLAVKDFFMRGAHREELAIVLGQQATVCYWIGDIV